MHLRVCARLGLLSAIAVGAVVLAVHLDVSRPAPGASQAASRTVLSTVAQTVPESTSVGIAPVRPAAPADAQNSLQTALAPAGAPVRTFDESQPHTHVLDPRTGGLISVAGAVGTVAAPSRLGPVHADPLPAGVDLSDPTDTRSLLRRAALEPTVLAEAGGPGPSVDGPEEPASAAPTGTPGIRTLATHVEGSCSGTGSDGNRVQVLYVREADTASRYAPVLPILRNEVANVDDVFALSAQQTGGVRRVRWVHDADCLPVIRTVTVPDGSLGSDFWATITAVKAQGYAATNRKYLMFTDANQLCGVGTVYGDTRLVHNANDGGYASYARVDTNCWSSGHSVAAHELTHNLGGVLGSAPHATKNGHCWDESDLMCYDDGSGVAMRKVCVTAQEQLLDCNHDDYFNTSPAPGTFLADNWDTASSSFLDSSITPAPTSVPVTVSTSGATARTGDDVVLRASSPRQVTWTWSRSSAGSTCSLLVAADGSTSTLRCPSSVAGAVTVTAVAIEVGTGRTGAGSAVVTLSRAAAPTAAVSAPASAPAGEAFAVRVTSSGTSPSTYAWQAGSCTADRPTEVATTVACPAGSASQDLLVSVVVTQADGQSVRGTATVRLTGKGGTTVPPRVTPEPTSWSPATLVGSTLGATLRDSRGDALSGRPVTLQVRWKGTGGWADLAALTTDSSGRAAARLVYPRVGAFRFASAAGQELGASVSSAVSVKVQTRVRVRAASGHRLVATLTTTAGTRVPRTPMSLQRRTRSSSRWVTETTARTNARGVVFHRVRPSRTTYVRWVFLGGTDQGASQSQALRVR